MLNVSAFSSPNKGAQLQAFCREEVDCESRAKDAVIYRFARNDKSNRP
jgi:hypothetical protein